METSMYLSRAQVDSNAPVRCLTRLCKHWGHKFQVKFDSQRGEIFFDPATCFLEVNDNQLWVRLETPDTEELSELEEVVADHLQRMAGEETLLIQWVR